MTSTLPQSIHAASYTLCTTPRINTRFSPGCVIFACDFVSWIYILVCAAEKSNRTAGDDVWGSMSTHLQQRYNRWCITPFGLLFCELALSDVCLRGSINVCQPGRGVQQQPRVSTPPPVAPPLDVGNQMAPPSNRGRTVPPV